MNYISDWITSVFGIEKCAYTTNEEIREISASVPSPIRRLVMVVMAYVLLNFLLIIFSRPNRQGWDAHITIRLFTGHPLIFFLLPAVYFRYIAQR